MRTYIELPQILGSLYANNFNYIFDWLFQYIECLPQFLHPFVENAIIHGLSGISRECKIQIDISLNRNILTIVITDNGRGIKLEILEKLNNLSTYNVGYGIKNAYERLTLAYNESGKIFFESVYEEYTRVTISFDYTTIYDYF